LWRADCHDDDATAHPGGFEGAYWIPGGQLDCTLCADGLDNDCSGYTDLADSNCSICNFSPIVIDVAGNGFDLSSAQAGVIFDINAIGNTRRISWTKEGSDDAWLVLDRNNNGLIDNGRELFGNFTPQTPSSAPQGFIALRVYDRTESGGNRDGKVSTTDAIFSLLRLWQDVNHNGISETNELSTLTSKGIYGIDLNYKESRRRDEHGNIFRYRSKVYDLRGGQVGRWAWDVFLHAAE
jgi:hypothetical protein